MQQFLTAAWRRVTALILRRRLERDLDDELAFHLAMREADYRAAGLSGRRRARRSTTAVRQRDAPEGADAGHVDFSFLSKASGRTSATRCRTLRKSPAFTAVAVFALAVGIGGNTAIFSLVDAIRVRALPYAEPERLVLLWGNVQRAKVERRGASYPDYLDWRAQAKSFDDMAAGDSQTMTLTGGDEPERINDRVRRGAGYFSLLGVSPARGRVFRPEEDLVSTPTPVVVMSDGLWKRRFGADPQIVGRTITLNARVYEVIGLMPPGFKGSQRHGGAVGAVRALRHRRERWPSAAREASPRSHASSPASTWQRRSARWTPSRRQLETAYPNTNEKRGVEVSPLEVELFGDPAPGAPHADGGRGVRSAHRVRERLQPADRAVGSTPSRDCRANRARRGSRPPVAPARSPKAAC